jgi:hypothetical protein
MRIAALAVTLAMVACAHVKVAPPRIGTALLLEAHLDSTVLQSGRSTRVRYVLRNTSTTPIEFCQVEPGVTTTIGVEGRRMPVRGYGAGLGCRELRLRPGEGREFIEDCPVPAFLGVNELIGLIRVCTTDGRNEATITSAPLHVTITPANTALHPTPGSANISRRG